jgi:transposase
MQAYSKEMRRDVLATCDSGVGTRKVALRFNCSESWVRRVKQERREQGKTAPCSTRRRVAKWEKYRERIERLIATTPDMTLQELKLALQTDLCRQTLCVALRRLKLTLKKKRCTPRSKIGPTSRNDGPNGKSGKRDSIPNASFSSTKRG